MKLFSAGLLAVAFGTPLNASTILSSFPQSSSVGFVLNGSPAINDAAGFTMGGTAFQLDSVTIRFEATGIASFASNQVFADLYGGTGGGSGVPAGSPLVGLTTGAATIFDDTELTYTPASVFTLQANTPSWVVLHVSDTVTGNLGWASASSAPTGLFAVSEGQAQASNLPPSIHNNGSPLMYQVDGTALTGAAAPEPGATLLFASGGLALALLRRAGRK